MLTAKQHASAITQQQKQQHPAEPLQQEQQRDLTHQQLERQIHKRLLLRCVHLVQ
jgi:hypothetical protein